VATLSAGIIGGALYKINKGEFIGAYKATLAAISVELYHMGITLILAKPYSQALEVVKIVIIPMVIANAMGVGIFSIIIGSLIQDKRTIKHLEEELTIVQAKDEQNI
jgi:sigma-B regulation protein RsbU (phosphoserine phosphatase)